MLETPSNGTPKLLLTSREAAAALSISQKTLWSWSQPRGSIPTVKIGERSVRYSVAALERWIAEQGAQAALAAQVDDGATD